MLVFVGLGLEQSPTMKALEELKECDKVFLENYTSPTLGENLVPAMISAGLDASKLESVPREFVEDGRKILELASSQRIALMASGDPLVATTHQELRTRAFRRGIPTRIMHGSSIACSVAGELGLHSYNFGRMVTLTDEPLQYTAYDTIFQNLLRGLHTIVLLQWDQTRNFFLSPKLAVESLLNAENDLKYGILDSNTLILVASRVATPEMGLTGCTFSQLRELDLGNPPYVLVLPGSLHFTEKEALGAILGKDPNTFRDNTSHVVSIAKKMVEKYSRRTLEALGRARTILSENKEKKTLDAVLENVECYAQDSTRFINEGKPELAVLSIGYAEGLLDSLRFAKILDFEW